MPALPNYLTLFNDGTFLKRIALGKELLKNCNLCPRNCGIDRTGGDVGFCQSSNLPVVAAYSPHFGEEPVLSGKNGAGNIFFGNCNLKCVFCQNFEISQNSDNGKNNSVNSSRLAEIMLELQQRGCHNIGLVSPTHFSIQILESIYEAISKGLTLPIVYNSNGYDSVEILKLFDGIVDVYLPDFKYGDNIYGKRYSKVNNYFEYTKIALREMYRQVGPKHIYDNDILVHGLVIRHLVLPNGLAESEKIFKFIAEELSSDVYISLMSQYYPTNQSNKHILLNRTVSDSEFNRTMGLMQKYGLSNGWIQHMDSSDNYLPNFNLNPVNPFNN